MPAERAAAVPRLTVVHCPQWPVVATGCGADDVVAVVHANRIVARSRAAAAAGVRLGQRRREAQGRCPALTLVPHDPGKDARIFTRVADAVATIVPRLELTHPGTLTFPTRGPSRYFGGDQAMAERVVALVAGAVGDTLRAVGHVGIGVADGRFAAGVAARHGARAARPHVVAAGGSPAFLAPLSLRWLIEVGEVTPEHVDLLHRLGLRSLGDLAAMPEPDVLARFGRPGTTARRLASGADDRPAGTVDPPAGLTVEQHFDTPLQHLDAVVFTGRALAERLVGTLAADGRVCTQFAVTAETEHGEHSDRLWSLSTGFSVGAVVERIRWQLDGWARNPAGADPARSDDGADHAPTAGVTLLRLEPTEVRADDGTQLGLWGGRTQADEWAQRAATRLAGLVGDEQVVVAEWRGGRQPGDLYRWIPASASTALDPSTASIGTGRTAVAPWPGSLPAPAPTTVYPEPRPVVVLDAHGAALTVSGRGVVSGTPVELAAADPRTFERAAGEPIVAWAGPWLLDERWWDAARHRRLARFQLLTAGGRAYLATVERQRWWLIAEYR